MSILNAGTLNAIKKEVTSKLPKRTATQTNITLQPNVQVSTNIFYIDSMEASLLLYTEITRSTGGVECAIRFHDEFGTVVAAGDIFMIRYKELREDYPIHLKSNYVSFRLVNKGTEPKAISSLSVAPRGVAINEYIPFYTGTKVFKGNTETVTEIINAESDSFNLSIYGEAGTLPASIGIGIRYYTENGTIHSIEQEEVYTLNPIWNTIKTIPLKFRRFVIRFKNYSATDFEATRMVISYPDSSVSGGGSDNPNSLPLSYDNALLVQHKSDEYSAGYDHFFGGFKALRIYKPDAELVVIPETVQKSATVVNEQFTLQNGVESLRIYLIATVTGNPFPNEADGIYLNIRYEEFSQSIITPVLTSTKIKSGTRICLLGSNQDMPDIDTFPILFGDNVKVRVNITGTLDESNYVTYKIISFQKFK